MTDAPTLEEWVTKAENDFTSAELLFASGNANIADAVCFHCQQCIEKYLKAFLQLKAVDFPRTHSLIALKELCVTSDESFEDLRDALSD